MGVKEASLVLDSVEKKKCCQGKGCSLAQLAEGEEATILEVPAHSLLAPLGFRPGKKVKVQTKQCCGGPIVAGVEGRDVAIDRQLACQIKLSVGEKNVS
ncbi:FeoA family protein [Fuchsiella alkaliacetigena]|uniref:FeoA family protein n=1 Tax=Fuchsiella alkaliacetigena TaxID=957042 RepID=UPI002009DBF8|nr:FeoA family protein [Fuchsiella alkaliacetigena]MCK8825271.1 ferrous iron transport protein A [Fuchsiella alkaliacetigena]